MSPIGQWIVWFVFGAANALLVGIGGALLVVVLLALAVRAAQRVLDDVTMLLHRAENRLFEMRYAAQGVRTVLVTCTGGEHGEIVVRSWVEADTIRISISRSRSRISC